MAEDLESRISSIIGERYDVNTFNLNDDGLNFSDHEKFISKMMKNIFGRTEKSFDNVEYELAERGFSSEDTPEELTIVSIASAINCFGTRGQLETRTFEDSRELCLPSKHYDRDTWVNDRSAEMIAALNLCKKMKVAPNIICYPELAYPPPTERTYQRFEPSGHGEKFLNTYFDRSSYGRNRQAYETRILEKLDKHGEPFTFLGTFHCPFDFYNLGVIYPLGPHKHELKARASGKYLDDNDVGRSPQEWALSPPIFYRKRFPARKLREFVRIPSNLEFHTYKTSGIRIGIMVCSDVMDANQLLNVARINAFGRTDKKIDVILVPSYNYSPKLLSMCRELSYLSRNIVVYVNANDRKKVPGTSSKLVPKSTIFVSGFEPTELQLMGGKAKSIVVDSKEAGVRGGRVVVTKLNLSKAKYFSDTIAKASRQQIGTGSGRTGFLNY